MKLFMQERLTAAHIALTGLADAYFLLGGKLRGVVLRHLSLKCRRRFAASRLFGGGRTLRFLEYKTLIALVCHIRDPLVVDTAS